MRGLAILEVDTVGAYLGDCIGSYLGYFLGMDLVWLKSVWDDGGTAHADIMEILISLALLKLHV